MTPDDVNQRDGVMHYRCRSCRVDHGLHWYRGTSCPVCSKPECIKFCDDEFAQAYYKTEDE